MDAELLVIDNASDDRTPEVVAQSPLPQITIRHIREDRIGLSTARNRGLAEAKGDILLFTDDDVRPCKQWIEGMSEPITTGRTDAVAGTILIAPHLRRPWMEPIHYAYLASNEHIAHHRPTALIGASMGFSRRVLERVPAFDEQLGPGALGFRDDVLFSNQLTSAGYRLTRAMDYPVVHHFDPARLSRASFLKRAKQEGRSLAYVAHHWDHLDLSASWRDILHDFVLFTIQRMKRRKQWHHRESAPTWEILALVHLCGRFSFLRERRKPRKYVKHGLVKLSQLKS